MGASLSIVWSRIWNIYRCYAGHPLLALDLDSALCASPLEVSTTLGLEFALHSNSASYSLRSAKGLRPLSFVDAGKVTKSYNVPFTMYELRFPLVFCKDDASGLMASPFLSFGIFILQQWVPALLL